MGGSRVTVLLITNPSTVKVLQALSSQMSKRCWLISFSELVSISWVSYSFLPTCYLGIPDFLCIVLCLRFVFTTKWSPLLLTIHRLHHKLSVNSLELYYAMLTSGFYCPLFTLCTWFSGPMTSTFALSFCSSFVYLLCWQIQQLWQQYSVPQLNAQILYSVLTFFCPIYFLYH